mgnify:CR=1 FL=1
MARGIRQLVHAFGVSVPVVARALGRRRSLGRPRCEDASSDEGLPERATGIPDSGREATSGVDEAGATVCRISVAQSSQSTVLVVEIKGSMPRFDQPTAVSARITLTDVVPDSDNPHPVLSRHPQHRDASSNAFCLTVGLGVVQPDTTVVSQWLKVAEVPVEWLQFPTKGTMVLAGGVELLCGESGLPLAAAQSTVEYINPELGYLDAECSLRKAHTLAVSLALAVTSAHHELSAAQVGRLRAWARSNILMSSETQADARQLDKALDKAAVFFARHHEVDLERICGDVATIVPIGNRCRIFELCLDAVRARGFADQRDISLLESVAAWLEIDPLKATTLLDEFLPATMRQVAGPDTALGITADMSPDDIRRRLNAQYRKWHARVTSSDPAVRAQADAMLRLISNVRSEHAAPSTAQAARDPDVPQDQAEEPAAQIGS